MKNILCPTDFSTASIDAIAYAAKFSQVTHSELTLLNVQSLFDITPVEFLTGKEFTMKATRERLEDQCKEVSKVYKIICTPMVEPTYNKLSTIIQEKSRDFDLIVMGSNGADDLYQFFFGSNAYNALAKSRTPLLLVPEGFLYNEIKDVLFAYDYLRERKLPLRHLLPFVRATHSDLTVLQVMEEARSKEADDDLRELQFILQTKANGFPLNFETVRSSEVARSIDAFILDRQPDVLALCSQGRSFLEGLFHKSVIKDISVVCSYPVLVFPEE